MISYFFFGKGIGEVFTTSQVLGVRGAGGLGNARRGQTSNILILANFSNAALGISPERRPADVNIGLYAQERNQDVRFYTSSK
jgi:hypothetical protein